MRWRFRHVLVDEAQDLNPVQFRLLELVVGGRDDLYLVGDPAQAIYGFNGADPTLLADIAERLPGVEVIRLPTNHRSTPQIVAAGSHVLRSSGHAVEALASRPDGDGGAHRRRGRRGRRVSAGRPPRPESRSRPRAARARSRSSPGPTPS